MDEDSPDQVRETRDKNFAGALDAEPAAQPPGTTPVLAAAAEDTTVAAHQTSSATGASSRPVEAPEVRMQRSRHAARASQGLQPPGATTAEETLAAANAKLAAAASAHASEAMAKQAEARQQRLAGARPKPSRRRAAAAVHLPPGATETATKATAEPAAAAGQASKSGSADGDAEESGASITYPHYDGGESGGDAPPTSDSQPPGATRSPVAFSPPLYHSSPRFSTKPAFQALATPLILLAAIAATVSFWERRHSGTSRPRRGRLCLGQLGEETSVHSKGLNKGLYSAESTACAVRAVKLWVRQTVHSKRNLYAWYEVTPPYDVARPPIPYLWHSYATLIIEHRLPWLGHGLANTASPND